MEVNIHQWTVNDLAAVRHIALTTWLATYSGFIPAQDIRLFFDEWYTIEKLQELCNSPTARGFIAELDSNAVGFAKTSYNPDEKKFSLHSLYVVPGCQGKGIGKRLLDATEAFACSFGAEAIWLGVMTQNLVALNWYQRIGFQFEKEEPFTMGNTTVMHLIGFRKINRERNGN